MKAVSQNIRGVAVGAALSLLALHAWGAACDNVEYAELKDMKTSELRSLYCEDQSERLDRAHTVSAHIHLHDLSQETADEYAQCTDQTTRIERILKNRGAKVSMASCGETVYQQCAAHEQERSDTLQSSGLPADPIDCHTVVNDQQ